MCKKMLSYILCVAMLLTALPMLTFTTVAAQSTNLVVMPSNDGLTNNTSYTLGAGTDAETTVYCDFRASGTAPTGTFTPKYVTVHNTGTYVSTANAKNTHNNTNKISDGMAWHYTVDNNAIYQGLQDTRKGWHIGSVSKNPNPTNTNSNSIGIEMCVHNFPATETFDGEQWTDGTAILNWWETQFDQTMKNTAYLTLVLCKRWGLDWRTDVKMHYDALNYYPGGKDCPMQMRATYDPTTNTFTEAGSYVDGRDGYFWQMFWKYMEAYASGSDDADNDNLTSAGKLGTYQVTPSDGLNVRAGADSTYEKVGVLECGDIVKVTELSGNWGKVVLKDGTEGWCNIVSYGKYIGVDAQAYTTGVNTNSITYFYDVNGSLTVKNNSSDQGQFDLFTPHGIGTATTPYMNVQVTPLTGDGYYFGLTQNGSAYFMMHNSTLSEKLTVATESTYCKTAETLEINLQEYWVPEEKYQIDQVRFYIAPNSSIKIDYCYFATSAGLITDETYNLVVTNNINLMDPSTLTIPDNSKYGSYVYNNGTLTVTADTDAGFDVRFDVNMQFEIDALKRWLISMDSAVPFNISLLVTHADGEGYVSLVNDYYPTFVETAPTNGYLPAWTGNQGFDLQNYYVYNNIVPTSGISTVKEVHINLGGAGTATFSGIQLSRNYQLIGFEDGVYKTDAVTDTPIPPVINGDVNGDGEITTSDARMILNYTVGVETLTAAQIAAADYDGDGEVTTTDARDILMSIVA